MFYLKSNTSKLLLTNSLATGLLNTSASDKILELSAMHAYQAAIGTLSGQELQDKYTSSVANIASQYTITQLSLIYNVSTSILLQQSSLVNVSNLLFQTTDSDFVAAFKMNLSTVVSVQILATALHTSSNITWTEKTLQWLLQYKFAANIENLLLISPNQIMQLHSTDTTQTQCTIEDVLLHYTNFTAASFVVAARTRLSKSYLIDMKDAAEEAKNKSFTSIADGNYDLSVDALLDMPLKDIIK
jgi:hypothetical protein